MRFHVLTLFPEAFGEPLEIGVIGQAIRKGLISVETADIRSFTYDRHGTADDYQFGGGHGMVMKPEPLFEAVESALSGYTHEQRDRTPVIFLTPQGERLTQRVVEDLSQAAGMVLICGHYAGVDERAVESLPTRQISIGDYVLTGGELPAMILIDAVSRLVPGVVGSPESVTEDSITTGLLQHPIYTRPAEFRGMAVPEVLRSGHHAEIERWRRRESLRRTLARRPDLLKTASLSDDDRKFLDELGYAPDG